MNITVKLLRSVKDDSGWIEPGVVRPFEESIARKLIRQRSAVEVTVPQSSVTSEDSSVPDETTERLEQLMTIDGVTSEIASRLFNAGFKSVQDVAEAQISDLVKVKGITRKNVARIQESADDVLDK